MKVTHVFAGLIITGIVSVFFFSSFHKISREENKHVQNNATQSNTDVGYKSNTKQATHQKGIQFSTAFENDYFTPAQRKGHFYIELNADKVQHDTYSRIPLNISVVLDRSGSMSGIKMQQAKQAAMYVVDQLSENDFLSVVIYDNEIQVLVPTGPVTNKSLIKSIIAKVNDRGGTNLMGGAMKGYEEVKKNYKPGFINRVLLLSDGQANEGITKPDQIDRIVRQQSKENGISISTFGLGNDYNEDLMTGMAESGAGNYYFIDQAEKIAGIFKKELNGLMEVIAQQVEVKVIIPEYVNIDKVYGCRFEQTGNVISIPLHDIFSEETKGILIAYSVWEGKNMPIRFKTEISYTVPEEPNKTYMALQNTQTFTTQTQLYNTYFNEWVSAQVALYVSNETLETAMKEVDKGNYQQARKIVAENKKYMDQQAPLMEKSTELKRAYSTNAAYEENIQDAEKMDESTIKFIQKTSKSESYKLRNKK